MIRLTLAILLLMPSVPLFACTIPAAIENIRPGAEWVLHGETYNGLEWLDKTQIKPTLAEVQAAIADCPNQANLSNRNTAITELLSGTSDRDKLIRGILLSLLDELNNRRDWDAAMKAAVAASTSLADLKTRVATLPDAPDITVQQAKTAVQNKISSGASD